MPQFGNLSAESLNILKKYNDSPSLWISEWEKELIVTLYSMRKDANPELLGFLQEYIVDLTERLSVEDIHTLLDEYYAVVQYSYEDERVSERGFFRKGEPVYRIPKSILDLCKSLFTIEDKDDILLPYAGESQIVHHLKGCAVDGFEANPRVWAYSQIILEAYGQKSSITRANSYLNAGNKQYDFAFAYPSFNTDKDGVRSIANNLYEIAATSLKENGILCCILPPSFCHAPSGWFDLRKILLDKPHLFSAGVISLPSGLIPFSNIEVCLFFLTKNSGDSILLMDARGENFVVTRKDQDYPYSNLLKLQSILETLDLFDEQFVWHGKISDLNPDLNLLPSKYLANYHLPKVKEGEQLMKYKDLIEFIPLSNFTKKSETKKLVGMKELSFNYLNCNLSYNEIPTKKIKTSSGLSDNCLLAGFIGKKFKVGKAVDLSEQNMIALRPEVFPFRIKVPENIITEEFLLRSIMSEETEKQAKMFMTGVSITRISKEDFLDLYLVVPPIKEQERLCKDDTRKSLSEADRKQLESFEDYLKDLHMQKHAIGQTISSFNDWWSVLQRARRENDGNISNSTVVGRVNKVSVAEIFNNLQDTVLKLQKQISRLDRGNGLSVETFAISTFLEEYIESHKRPTFRFLYNAEEHHFSGTLPSVEYDENNRMIISYDDPIFKDGDTWEYVTFSKMALTIVLDNIIDNACSHGFTNRESDNIIKIEFRSEGTNYIITVSNNGQPLHPELSSVDVFTYGKSSKNGHGHSGIGGYEVKKLMKQFGGDAEIILTPDEEFTFTYKLTLKDTESLLHI